MHIKRVAIFSLIIIGTSYGLFRAIRVPAKTITIAAAPTVLPTASASAQPSARPSPSPTPSPLATTYAKINKYPETKLTPGATPVDYAFAVHTLLGYRVGQAKVNGKIVPLNYELQNGDVVEIIPDKRRKLPSDDWLSFVVTTHARHAIMKAMRDGTKKVI